MNRRRWGAWGSLVAVLPWLGCSAVVKGGRLSDRGDSAHGIYLTTGGSPRPFRTLGFAQVMGEGRTVAGIVDVGDAAFDGTIRGSLAEAGARMGGDAVIHIEFVDENPPTTYERAAQAASTAGALLGQGNQVSSERRNVFVTGEIIQFTDQ